MALMRTGLKLPAMESTQTFVKRGPTSALLEIRCAPIKLTIPLNFAMGETTTVMELLMKAVGVWTRPSNLAIQVHLALQESENAQLARNCVLLALGETVMARWFLNARARRIRPTKIVMLWLMNQQTLGACRGENRMP
jgi:hypothetical protein